MSPDEMMRKLVRHRILIRALEEEHGKMILEGSKTKGMERFLKQARRKFCDDLITAGNLCKKDGDRVTAHMLSREYARHRKFL
tara:strand:+ start:4704 stop:4952 length:249 start_codon:yes stop_codon:yes gene_type:complete